MHNGASAGCPVDGPVDGGLGGRLAPPRERSSGLDVDRHQLGHSKRALVGAARSDQHRVLVDAQGEVSRRRRHPPAGVATAAGRDKVRAGAVGTAKIGGRGDRLGHDSLTRLRTAASSSFR
jgi:hypothetical protein